MKIKTQKLIKMAEIIKATSSKAGSGTRMRISLRPNIMALSWLSPKGSVASTASCEMENDLEMDFAINGTNFVESLKPYKKADGECEIVFADDEEDEAETLEFKIGASTFQHRISNPDGLPLGTEIYEPIVIFNQEIRKALKKALSAINPNDVRRPLTGVLVRLFHNKVIFTGTNGVKLVEATTPTLSDLPDDTKLILRYEAAQNLVKCAGLLKTGQIIFSRNAEKLIITHDKYGEVRLDMRSSLITETYPDIEPLFANPNQKVGFKIPDLLNLIKKAEYDLDDCDNNRLQLLIYNAQLVAGTERTTSSCLLFTDDTNLDLTMDINGKFLRDILENFSTDKAYLNWRIGDHFLTFEPYVSGDLESERVLVSCLKQR